MSQERSIRLGSKGETMGVYIAPAPPSPVTANGLPAARAPQPSEATAAQHQTMIPTLVTFHSPARNTRVGIGRSASALSPGHRYDTVFPGKPPESGSNGGSGG